MIQQSMRLKVLILPLSLAISVVVLIFFIQPSFSEMTSAKGLLEEKKNQLDGLKNQSLKLQDMKSKWESLAEEKALVSSAIPGEVDIDSYVSELTSKASRSGILLTDIQKQKNNSGAEMSPAYVCSGDLAENPSPPAEPSQSSVGSNASSEAGMEGTAVSAIPALDCLEAVEISLSAKGSWEQILDFFKYLEDMNRISNIETSSLSVKSQSSSDLLAADISVTAFFKKKGVGNNMAIANSLASQGSFNQGALEKLKGVIYSPYAAPPVSPGGERNIFK